MIDIDSHEIALTIEIVIDPGCDFSGFGPWPLGQVDIEGVGFRVVVESHGSVSSKSRSKKALWTVMPSSRVTTRRYLAASGTRIQYLTRPSG